MAGCRRRPNPITKLTWDNPALISPSLTAEQAGRWPTSRCHRACFGRQESFRSSLSWIHSRCQADETRVTVHLGYGRTKCWASRGRAPASTPTSDPHLGYTLARPPELSITPQTSSNAIAGWQACTAPPSSMAPRPRSATWFAPRTLAEFQQASPTFAQNARSRRSGHELSLYPGRTGSTKATPGACPSTSTRCIGCNACMVACQAENNVPVVGKDKKSRSRPRNALDSQSIAYLGRLARRSENSVHYEPVDVHALREARLAKLVCPGRGHGAQQPRASTTWSTTVASGRDIVPTTAPYKVRRFNFLQYSDLRNAQFSNWMHNPDVTVRSAGGDGKVHLLRPAHQPALASKRKKQGRAKSTTARWSTACQSGLPGTEAIVFGDINDPSSRGGAQSKSDPRHYGHARPS